jgi:hypothetical protein
MDIPVSPCRLDSGALWRLIERGAPLDLPILRPALLRADAAL